MRIELEDTFVVCDSWVYIPSYYRAVPICLLRLWQRPEVNDKEKTFTLVHDFRGFRSKTAATRALGLKHQGASWQVPDRSVNLSMAARQQRETEREGSEHPLQKHTPGDMPSTATHLLKVPPSPSSTSDQGPSLHHRGPWRTLQTHTWH